MKLSASWQGKPPVSPHGQFASTEFAPHPFSTSDQVLKIWLSLTEKKTTLCARLNKTAQNMFSSCSLLH